MQHLNDLKDLLLHEILSLVSAEDQLIEALPTFIEKAENEDLKKALKEDLRITQFQRKRLDQVNNLLEVTPFKKLQDEVALESKGLEGILQDGNVLINLPLNLEIKDASITAIAIKIKQFEICGYGLAMLFAKKLKLDNVALLLKETLQEEKLANELLYKLASGEAINVMEEKPADKITDEALSGARPKVKTKDAKSFYGGNKGPVKKTAAKGIEDKKAPYKKSAPNRRQVAPKNSGETKDGGRNTSRSAKGNDNKRPAKKTYSSPGRSTGGRTKSSSKGKSGGGKANRSSGGGRGHS